MPLGDGTGPNGKGPRTGRGLGPCKPGTKNKPTVRPRPRLGRNARRAGGRGGRRQRLGR